MTSTKEWLQQTIAELEEERDAVPGVVNEDAAMALAAMKLALASLEAEPDYYVVVTSVGVWQSFCKTKAEAEFIVSKPFNPGYSILEIYTAPPAPASVPDDVSGPLAHAYKELTPTFMRNHIDVFERYGIYPDGSAGIQAMRIALDGMNRRAAMLQGAENAESPTTMQTAPSLDSSQIIAESPSGNSPVIPDCSCGTCRPVTFTDSRFVVCSECGNKRCSHANDHRNACTGSNEPGQEGRAYPAAPQQEVK